MSNGPWPILSKSATPTYFARLTNASSRNGLQTADEAFEDKTTKEATNPGNKKAVVESRWDAEKTIQLRILSMSL